MRSHEVSRQLQRLHALIRRTTEATSGDIELQAEWARYICIVAAGFLENALKTIYSEFVERASSRPVAGYAKSTLARIQNPKAEQFLNVAGAFNTQWRDELERFLEAGGRDAINSIMANRHLIAHGKLSGISMVPLRDYIAKSVEVLEFIETQCHR